jgi:hypothetical protein
MALEARVKENYRWFSVVALEGTEFIKSEWRPVPITREGEALRTGGLEVREIEEAKIRISTPHVSDQSGPVGDLPAVELKEEKPAKKAPAKKKAAKKKPAKKAPAKPKSDAGG